MKQGSPSNCYNDKTSVFPTDRNKANTIVPTSFAGFSSPHPNQENSLKVCTGNVDKKFKVK